MIMDYKKLIYDLINSDDYNKMTLDEIAISLNVPNEDFTSFVKAFNELDNEGLLYVSKKNYIYLAIKQNIHTATITKILRYKILARLEDDKIITLEKDDIYLYPGDLIQVKEDHDENYTFVKFLSHSDTSFIATYKNHKFISDEKYFPFDLRVNIKDVKIKDGDVVLLYVYKYDKDNLFAKIEKILGNSKDPNINIIKEVAKSGVRYEFSSELLKEAKKIVDEKKANIDNIIKDRKNLTDKLIVTIDGIDAKDLDDAISVEISDDGYYLLGVHIADVSYYVDKDSKLDMEAYKRATSIYLGNMVIPMFPNILSDDVCSLNPNTLKLTMSCFMKIDGEGNLVDYEITPSYIISKHRLNYDDINLLFDKKETTYNYDKELKEMLFLALRLSNILKKKMVNDGYISLTTYEPYFIFDDKNNVIDIKKRVQGKAESLIENFMIMANNTVASAIYYMQLPFVYRVHPKTTDKKYKILKESLAMLGINIPNLKSGMSNKMVQDILNLTKDSDISNIVNDTILRCMQKAYYSVENVGHFGLGLDNYCHFTSPIRRYPDLMVARLLKQYLVDNNFDDDLDYLILACDNSSKKERQAQALERKVESILKASYMENYIGDVYDGIVSGVTDFGVFVMLDNTVEGLIFNEKLYDLDSRNGLKIGSKLTVMVESVNVPFGEINFVVVNKMKYNRKR